MWGYGVSGPGGEPGRWRAVWCEDGQRQQCEAMSKDKLAARLDKVTERLQVHSAAPPGATSGGPAVQPRPV
jgi:hypothetical protein